MARSRRTHGAIIHPFCSGINSKYFDDSEELFDPTTESNLEIRLSSDLDIQHAIEAGKRNLEAKELVQNWCGHARVEKFGGTGLIEMETGLPIGHHTMVCDYAPAGGMATWLLEESAIHFHDSNCVGCSKRLPIRLPNISKLISRRDSEVERVRVRNEELKRQQQAAFDSRCSVRAALRLMSTVTVATFVDDLQVFDEERDDTTAHRLIESTRLAPEILTPEVTEHLFSLLESGEHWFDEVGLTILGASHLNPARLARCAMRCLAEGRALDLAAEIVANNISYVEARDVRDSVLGLAFVASPPHSPLDFDDPRRGAPDPLRRIFDCFPAEVSQGIEDLLSMQEPFQVRMGARAIIALAPDLPDLLASLRRSLATRLVRADILIDVSRDSELREVVHDLTQALICAFISDPEHTDAELMRYFEGASKEGEARLSGVYERVISQVSGSYNNGEEITSLNACRTALRRLVNLAGTSENEGVIRDIQGALRGDPGSLAPLACELMDMLLGAAALADSRLAAFAERSPLILSQDFLTALEQDNRRRNLWYLRASFVRWAVHGATVDSYGLTAFTDFLGRSASLSEELRAAIIEELPPLMETGAGLNAVLPFLYAAMVGESNLIRAAAAKAIEEIGSRRFNELPGLVAEAFLLMLFDPYVIVHKSAVRALRQLNLPEELRAHALAALSHLIAVYRGEQDQEFMLMCMEVYASGKGSDEQFKAKLGRVFIAILGEMKPTLLVMQNHQWLLRYLSEVDGYAELVLGLFEHCDSDCEIEHVLDLVHDIPDGTTGQHIAAVRKAVANDPSDAIVIGTFLEVLTRDGEWAPALAVAQAQLDAVPAATRMRVRWLLAQQQRCQAEFEFLIAQGKVEEALSIAKVWDAASAEINQIREQNEKTNPF